MIKLKKIHPVPFTNVVHQLYFTVTALRLCHKILFGFVFKYLHPNQGNGTNRLNTMRNRVPTHQFWFFVWGCSWAVYIRGVQTRSVLVRRSNSCLFGARKYSS